MRRSEAQDNQHYESRGANYNFDPKVYLKDVNTDYQARAKQNDKRDWSLATNVNNLNKAGVVTPVNNQKPVQSSYQSDIMSRPGVAVKPVVNKNLYSTEAEPK